MTWFTAESFGGPARFTRELGFDHLIEAHRDLEISEEERQRFGALYMEALDETGLPDDEPFREAVRSHIEFGSRVAQQNSRPRPTPTSSIARGSKLDVAARDPRIASCRAVALWREGDSCNS